MAHQVEFSPAAARDVRGLSQQMQKRVLDSIANLADTPRPRGCVKLKDEKGVYRIRTGDYRILYMVKDAVVTVLVLRVRHRREVYRSPAA